MTYNKIVYDVLWLLLVAEVRKKACLVCTLNRTSDIMLNAKGKQVVSL